ncbi:hypothetical protein B0I35DRAFT_479394 [Stachybotrys elegans]|uniref:Uncharacterized protein n=1 Tax=Stachybotrys elegans TaxID=80388 RepID=A0A8K0WPT3_9HYPO|nr:hypothetical protein B0I35DRAFT_479394 [Stachybotrys elegans]
MESHSKLADLTLVSKYYPVANYSYPRNQSFSRSHRGSTDRSSFGSSGSAPSLVDDRTDSESSSADEEYQYHAHASELWDSFWQSGADSDKEDKDELLSNPRRHYPALVPSPQRRRQVSRENVVASPWPLKEAKPSSRPRKPSATYSPFPKPITLPAPNLNPTPSWTSSRQQGVPVRPPRPDNELLMPCVREPTDRLVVKTSVSGILKHQRSFNVWPATQSSGHSIERTSRPMFNPIDWNRPATSQGTRPITPLEPTASASYDALGRLRANSTIPITHTPRSSITPIAEGETEPRSVFEFDDDEEDTKPEPHTRKFFLFHRRAESDRGRDADSTEGEPNRKRANTTPPQSRQRGGPRRQGDVWGRMLGRRSR